MISNNTILIALAIIESSLTLAVILIAILKRKNKMFLVSQLLISMLIICVITCIFISGETVGYKDGTEYTDISHIEYDESKQQYKVETTDNNRIYCDDCIYGEETKVVKNCKIIKETLLGINTYENGNILVVQPKNIDINNMSESEKKHYFNN